MLRCHLGACTGEMNEDVCKNMGDTNTGISDSTLCKCMRLQVLYGYEESEPMISNSVWVGEDNWAIKLRKFLKGGSPLSDMMDEFLRCHILKDP